MLRINGGANEDAPLIEPTVELLRLETCLGYIANSNVFIRLGERRD